MNFCHLGEFSSVLNLSCVFMAVIENGPKLWKSLEAKVLLPFICYLPFALSTSNSSSRIILELAQTIRFRATHSKLRPLVERVRTTTIVSENCTQHQKNKCRCVTVELFKLPFTWLTTWDVELLLDIVEFCDQSTVRTRAKKKGPKRQTKQSARRSVRKQK